MLPTQMMKLYIHEILFILKFSYMYMVAIIAMLTLYTNKYLFFIDPIVAMQLFSDSIPTVYQPLILQCEATVVRGITSTVDIIWTTRDTQVRRVNNVTASSNINSISVYNDSFIIPSLDISDIGSTYQCEVFVNSILPTTAKVDFIIPIPGMKYNPIMT